MTDTQSITSYSALTIAICAVILVCFMLGLLVFKCMNSQVMDEISCGDPCGCLPISLREQYGCACCISQKPLTNREREISVSSGP